MDKTFWLEPGRLAGRPGPDREPWNVSELHAGGIRAVLSVNDGAMCREEDFTALGMTYACVPMPDKVPPRPGDDLRCLGALERTYAFIDEQTTAGRAVMVHCSSGKDRTGLVLAHYLLRNEGCEPEQALATVRRVRPIALNADGWEQLAMDVLRRVALDVQGRSRAPVEPGR